MLNAVGVSNDRDLRDFKFGFLKDGGCFWSKPDRSHVGWTQFIVRHKDLHLASKNVRAFLQERGRDVL